MNEMLPSRELSYLSKTRNHQLSDLSNLAARSQGSLLLAPWTDGLHCRLRLVPHLPSGILSERNACAHENHPTRESRDAAGREKNQGLQTKPNLSCFSLPCVGWLSRALAFRSLYYSLVKQGMLVVYDSGNLGGSVQHATWKTYSVSDQNIWFSMPWTANVKGWMTKKIIIR